MEWFGLWFETTTGKLIDVAVPGEGPLDERVTVRRGAGLYPPPRTVHVISLPAHEFMETARRLNARVRIEWPPMDGVYCVALVAVLRLAGFKVDPAQEAELASGLQNFERNVRAVMNGAPGRNLGPGLAELRDVEDFMGLAQQVYTPG
jgi:hypothetical protein